MTDTSNEYALVVKPFIDQLESLLALCDRLETEVVAAEEVRGRLLAAVLNGQ